MRICSIGECMVELNSSKHNSYNLTFAGDTGNTAVYLSRLGAKTYYLTSIGKDKLSNRMEEFLQKEKISNTTIGKIIFINPLLLGNDFTAKFNYYSIFKSPYLLWKTTYFILSLK